MLEKQKKIIKYLLSIVITSAFIYYAIKDVEFDKLWDVLINADYIWVLVSLPVIVLSHWVRAVRWKTMFKPIHKAKSVWNLFSAVMVGYAVNCVIPRGGELVRPYVYARRAKISRSTSFATIIVERILDVMSLLILFVVVFFIYREMIATAFPQLTVSNITIYIIVPMLAIIVMLFLSLYTSIGEWLLSKTIKRFSIKYYDKFLAILNKFLKGLEIVRTPSQYFRLTLETLLIWLFYMLPMYIMFFCFDFQNQFNLGIMDATFLLIVVGIATSLSPSPGAIGVYHSLVQTALHELYGLSLEEALAYATVVHGINYIVQLSIGAMFAARENFKDLPSEEDFDKLDTQPEN